LSFSHKDDYDRIEEHDRVSIVGLKDIKPGQPVKGLIIRKVGSTFEMTFHHTFTDEQIEWFRAGSALNAISPKS